jgi:pilus assembly protein Flp/PilA
MLLLQHNQSDRVSLIGHSGITGIDLLARKTAGLWSRIVQTAAALAGELTTKPVRESQMKNLFVRFAKDESGATAIEYGLIAAGISIAISVIVFAVGSKLAGLFGQIEAALP